MEITDRERKMFRAAGYQPTTTGGDEGERYWIDRKRFVGGDPRESVRLITEEELMGVVKSPEDRMREALRAMRVMFIDKREYHAVELKPMGYEDAYRAYCSVEDLL